MEKKHGICVRKRRRRQWAAVSRAAGGGGPRAAGVPRIPSPAGAAQTGYWRLRSRKSRGATTGKQRSALRPGSSPQRSAYGQRTNPVRRLPRIALARRRDAAGCACLFAGKNKAMPVSRCAPEQAKARHIAVTFGFTLWGQRDGYAVFPPAQRQGPLIGPLKKAC